MRLISWTSFIAFAFVASVSVPGLYTFTATGMPCHCPLYTLPVVPSAMKLSR